MVSTLVTLQKIVLQLQDGLVVPNSKKNLKTPPKSLDLLFFIPSSQLNGEVGVGWFDIVYANVVVHTAFVSKGDPAQALTRLQNSRLQSQRMDWARWSSWRWK